MDHSGSFLQFHEVPPRFYESFIKQRIKSAAFRIGFLHVILCHIPAIQDLFQVCVCKIIPVPVRISLSRRRLHWIWPSARLRCSFVLLISSTVASWLLLSNT